MRRLLAPILSALRRRPAPQRGAATATSAAAGRSTADVARALSLAIEEALAAGQTDRAWRVAASASRLANESPRLAERVARLHLAAGDTAAALQCIEKCRNAGGSLRLLRSICLIAAGRVADAHLDLHRWAGRSTAPLEARILLALMEWRAGRTGAARAALRRNLRQIEDPTSLALLLTMAANGDDREAADTLARRLRRATVCTPGRPDAELIILSLALPAARQATMPSPFLVRTLAAELVAQEPVIPSLVEAQKLAPDRERIELLAGALELARDELSTPIAAWLALAELELLRDRPEAARVHAQRALQFSPMSAAAALLVRRANEAAYGLRPADTPPKERAA